MTKRSRSPLVADIADPRVALPQKLLGSLARRITLRQLQIFEAVARNGSFTRAGEELLLAQPTVSMQVKKLAEAVGTDLFDQTGIVVRLTDIGRELYSACGEVFGTLNDLETRIADVQGLKRGRLRL